MGKSQCGECGHSKSDHADIKCKWPLCPCLEFKIEQKSQEKIESKTDRELKPEFGINAKMFQEFHGAGKKAKKTVSRSEGYDDIEKHWTNIGDAKKSDYKLKINNKITDF